jgi:hypothetical protein
MKSIENFFIEPKILKKIEYNRNNYLSLEIMVDIVKFFQKVLYRLIMRLQKNGRNPIKQEYISTFEDK